MPTFRCEFDVVGDLVLPPDVPELTLNGANDLAITFRNGPTNEDGQPVGLIAIVVGAATTLDKAQSELRDALARQLDLLAFVTHSRFRIARPLRLIEWESGQVTRRFQIFHTRDALDPPEPELRPVFLETVAALNNPNLPAFARTALKYFRYGLLDEQPEDQFMRLWLALEIVAENQKEKAKVPIVCSACAANMKCANCGDEPTRVPMAKQAIERLIAKIVGDKGAADVSKRQFIARNGLMHGRSRETIEAECKVPMHALVNELGVIAWNAIMSTIPLASDGKPLTFGHSEGQFTNMTLLVALLGSLDHRGNEPHPPENLLPNVQMTMQIGFQGRGDARPDRGRAVAGGAVHPDGTNPG